MLKKLKNKFSNSTSGNVAVIFGLTVLPIFLAIGGSIDIIRVTTSKAKLQSAVESSVLSAASLTNTLPVEDAVEEFVNSNVGEDAIFENLEVSIVKEEISLNRKLIKVKGEADVKMSFLPLAGITSQRIQVFAEAVEAIETMEISMVLDISSSMSGGRIANLRTAASGFVDQMLVPRQVDSTSISLVPFGGSVNLGPLFDNYVVDLGSANIDPSETEYNLGYNVTEQNFRFTDGDKCIEVRKEDVDLDNVPANSRPQLPHFWKFQDFNPWCPESTSAAIWNTNNAGLLKDRIDELTLSDGTGMDHGIVWGAKALSPALQGQIGGEFPQRPSPYVTTEGEAVQKIMVLMTDGAITSQFRPEDYTYQSTHTSPKNNKNQQRLLRRGNINHTIDNNSTVGNFKEICDQLKANGVHIFTIGFQISSDSLPEQLLQYCASNPANYYLVESLDIASAFNAIAASVQKLRISG